MSVPLHELKTSSLQSVPIDAQTPGLNRTVTARKTLIICPIGLGNFLMVTPMLKRLSAEIGASNMHLLALKGGIRQMAEASGYFGKIHFWDPDKGGKLDGLKMLAELRREGFDFSVALFPSGHWKFSLIALMSGAKTRTGFTYPHSGLPKRVQTYSHPLDPELHDTDQNMALLETLMGCQDDTVRELEFAFTPTHPQEELLQSASYYVCHPGSSAERGMKEKRLPPKAFAELAQRIYTEFGWKCLLVGGPEEQELRDEITAKIPHLVLPVESRNLAELAAIVDNAAFYLGNDSGLMHISAARGKRCIAFFGPTDDKRNGPYWNGLRHGDTARHLVVRRDDLTCSPCWTIHTVGANPACQFGDTRCLRDLKVITVWPRIRRFLSEFPSAAMTN